MNKETIVVPLLKKVCYDKFEKVLLYELQENSKVT